MSLFHVAIISYVLSQSEMNINQIEIVIYSLKSIGIVNKLIFCALCRDDNR